jgi:glucose/arabinose dehydrogenase
VDYSGASITPYEHVPGTVAPVLHWTPSIAPSGLAIYRGELFSQWRGDLLVGALVAHAVYRVRLKADTAIVQEQLFGELDERIRDVRVGPDGAVYLLTDSAGGRVLRALPANAP